MSVLPPDLAQEVAAAQAVAKAAADAARAAAEAAKAAAAAVKAAGEAAKAANDADGGSRSGPQLLPAAQQQQSEEEEDADTSSSSSKDTGPWLLLITSKGHGKRVALTDITIKKGRATQGLLSIKLSAGDTLALAQLVMSKDDDVVLASRQGVMIRCSAADVRALSRHAKGVRVIDLNEGDEVQTVAVVPAQHKTALA